ncbi:MAG: acyl dehydratase [Pseudomonadales bacterium]|nr:MAG: acyl dehydratase [Pseudomonadales bacterium]
MKYYEDVEVGDTGVFEQEYAVTQEEIVEVGQRWDPQPFHIDPVAAKDSMFGGLVASSAHIFAIHCCIGTAECDEDKNIAAESALGFNNLQWHSPVRPGDVIRSKYYVMSKRESSSRPSMGVVKTLTTLYNQSDETVFTIETTFLAKKRQ